MKIDPLNRNAVVTELCPLIHQGGALFNIICSHYHAYFNQRGIRLCVCKKTCVGSSLGRVEDIILEMFFSLTAVRQGFFSIINRKEPLAHCS